MDSPGGVGNVRLGIDTLLDGIAQFPTYSEGFQHAVEKLDLGPATSTD